MKNFLYLWCIAIVAILSSCIEGNLESGIPDKIAFSKEGGTYTVSGIRNSFYDYYFYLDNTQISDRLHCPGNGDTVRFSHRWIEVAILSENRLIITVEKYSGNSPSRSIKMKIKDEAISHDASYHELIQYNR